jgi:hypothetical protein
MRNKFCIEVVHPAALAKLYCHGITVLLGDEPFSTKERYIKYRQKGVAMMFILAVVVILLLLVLAGADLLVSQQNPDELSNMGVQEQ